MQHVDLAAHQKAHVFLIIDDVCFSLLHNHVQRSIYEVIKPFEHWCMKQCMDIQVYAFMICKATNKQRNTFHNIQFFHFMNVDELVH